MMLLLVLLPVSVMGAACVDSSSWFKKDQPWKDCNWVGDLSSNLRCRVKDAEGVFAYDACVATCSERLGETDAKRRLQERAGCVTELEPRLPGVLGGDAAPKIILAADINYPPYAMLDDETLDLSGFGVDFAQSLETVCNVEMITVQTQWAKCWGTEDDSEDERPGIGLLDGYFHGCMTYTNAKGTRNRYLEFSHAILNENKPGGLIARLDANGVPSVAPDSNLDGVTVIDVSGWAPTAGGLALVTNPCTGESYEGYTIVNPSETTENANDDALRALLAEEGDAIWIYSDQAALYQCEDGVTTDAWDCDLWSGLGTNFTYVATGLTGYANNGTTLSIAKKGAGLADTILNDCIQSFLATEDYYDLCVQYDLVDSCWSNSFFPGAGTLVDPVYNNPTHEQDGPCASGYCSCAGV